jgi:hypothetical protein
VVRLVGRGAGREEGDAARHAALGERLQGRGGGGHRGGDAGHDFDLDAGFLERAQFLVGAAEQHRVAAFQAHDALVAAGAIDQLFVDEGLGRGALAGALADRDLLGLRAQFQHLGVTRASYSTTSASPSRRAPRTVIRSAAPGPAPIK